MAEAKAGQQDAQQDEQLDGEQQDDSQEGQEGNEREGGEQQQQRQAERTYTQAELDRILSKVRKNARYLGRKEAEAELMARGATRSQAEAAVDRQQQQQREAPKAPKREDFENYEDYLVAKADFTARQASREEREAADKASRERTVREERARVDRDFSKVAKEEVAKYPEIAEAIEAADEVMMSEAMGDAIKEAGRVGVHILGYLAQNPDEAARIAALPSERAQAKEIGKLEAKVEAELKAKAKPQGEEGDEDSEEQEGEERDEESEAGAERQGKGKEGERNADGTFKSAKKRAAPEPIEPGSARSASGSRLPSDKDDIETWMRKEDERERREGRR